MIHKTGNAVVIVLVYVVSAEKSTNPEILFLLRSQRRNKYTVGKNVTLNGEKCACLNTMAIIQDTI